MKKILLMAGLTAGILSCSNDTTKSDTTIGDSANNTSTNAANATTTYTSTEGDVSYRDGRVMVWRNNAWVDADNDMTLDDGTVVRKNGRIVRNGEERELEDGAVVTKTGRFFDKAGNAIENGWEGLKKGTKEAAEEVKDGFNKAKDGVKDAVNDNDKKDNNQ